MPVQLRNRGEPTGFGRIVGPFVAYPVRRWAVRVYLIGVLGDLDLDDLRSPETTWNKVLTAS